jgi:hypothetical protein
MSGGDATFKEVLVGGFQFPCSSEIGEVDDPAVQLRWLLKNGLSPNSYFRLQDKIAFSHLQRRAAFFTLKPNPMSTAAQ